MRFRLRVIALIGLVCTSVVFLIARRRSVEVKGKMLEDAKSLLQISNTDTKCVKNKLELWPNFIKQLYESHNAQPLNCNREPDWVIVKNGRLKFVVKAKHVTCDATPYKRIDDATYEALAEVKGLTSGSPVPADFFELTCRGMKEGTISTYSNYHAAIKTRKEIDERPVTSDKKWNVIMFGFDSVSRMQWMRLLPKTYAFLTKELGSVVLEGYNIVGDGTPQALLPILAGKPETELPEARRNYKDASTLDGHPWIWKNYTANGYITQWGEDEFHYGTFQYRMLGFRKPPTDYYVRPFQKLLRKRNNFCTGSVPGHKVFMNWINELWRVYKDKPKFSFLFHSAYSHDYVKKLSIADDDVLEWIKSLQSSTALKDSFLIFMADHGPRFSSLRSNVQGKYEERNPFFSIRIPDEFQKLHPKALEILKGNAERLTTPFDVYSTLLDILNYKPDMPNPTNQRSLSLLRPIPKDRNCESAGIQTHWCSCLSWKKIDLKDKIVVNAVNTLIDAFNNENNKLATGLCHKLSLKAISNASMYEHGRDMLKFRKSADTDGRIPDFSDNMSTDAAHLRVNFITSPNDGKYEATLILNLSSKKIDPDLKQVSRVDRYGDQPKCIVDRFPDLRQFCYCV
ncbi:unnamed protein product [Dimorphilus gyrociliatus]|uniref:Uncharacterized protein n=1 Tax=Dimorphilus gyrociliatus TaxID=2664684 RepID=A0A7I8VTD8_9ANNE|nr:unnamed protein product [Dimorphilus gyrociliatus]